MDKVWGLVDKVACLVKLAKVDELLVKLKRLLGNPKEKELNKNEIKKF